MESRIEEVRGLEPNKDNLELEAALCLELEEWLEKDELKWKQKSRELWLKEGDRNSRFFHLSTVIRRRSNRINEIKMEDRTWIYGREHIGKYFIDHFKSLYQSVHPQFPHDLDGLIEAAISEEENESICRVPSGEEIRKIVFEMHPLKAPGPDGLSGIFYRHYWSIVGNQVINAVQSFFRDGWMLREFNQAFITLIPKKQGACNFSQFKPISLCNFCYKIISKILVSRLRPLLEKLIDPAQVAFVPNRWIAENVVLAQEVVNSFKIMKRKRGFLGVKLDFNKAYDRMEWNFLETVLVAFGFSEKVVHLLMQCVTTVQFTLLLNGGIWASFHPTRGLRQGDPLSPYLFILGSEVLLRLINREIQEGNLSGIKIGNSAPPLAKLCYADDVILICKAKMDKVRSLLSCIDTYCTWSGQSISIDKSDAFYSNGVHTQFKNQVKNVWGLKSLPQNTKYLGVPLFLSQNRKRDFIYLKERLEDKTSSWKSKSLSWIGRATLIKSVALTIPIYTMAAIQLPKKLCEEMDSVIRRFWWAPRKESNHFYAPTAWNNLCTPMQEGGLGFRKFWNLNQAILAKLAWWVLSKRDSFCVKILHTKYKVRGNWLNKYSGSVSSWTWESIEGVKHLISLGACLQVGNGNNILVWEDPWVPDCLNFIPKPKEGSPPNSSLAVSQLFNQDRLSWNEHKLRELFDPEDAQAISRIPLMSIDKPDKWIWTKANNGEFNLKSAYGLTRNVQDIRVCDPLWKNVWKSQLHERLKMLLWRIASNLLPTKNNLDRFINPVDQCCPLCEIEQESIVHIFVYCSVAKACWFGSRWSIKSEFLSINNGTQLVSFILNPPDNLFQSQDDRKEFSLFGTLLLDGIWRLRNSVVFYGNKAMPEDVLKILYKSFQEHWDVRKIKFSDDRTRRFSYWSKPACGHIKINCDAAIGPSYSVIAIVARDWRGSLLFALSKKVNTNIPVQAEAEALRWSVLIAVDRKLQKVMFENNSQICINAITLASFKPPWRIHGLILDIEATTKYIPGSAFNWVYREANEAAHQLANWSLKNAFFGPFDLNHAPSSFISVISNEAVSSSIV